MLYRLILVDDELHIRNGLKNTIDWSSIGYELIGVFSNGREAIECLQNHDVDVILTDIEMSNVSGLELADYVYTNFPNIIVVLLSAYNDFEYARIAMKYNVAGYLLKSETADKIVDFMKELKDKNLHKLSRQLNDNMKKDNLLYCRTRIANAILESKYETIEEIEKDLEKAEILNEAKGTTVTVFSVYSDKGYDEWKYGLEGFYNTIQNLFYFFSTDKNYFLCRLQNPILVVLLTTEKKDDAFFDEIEQRVSKTISQKVEFEIINHFDSVMDAVQADILGKRMENNILANKIISLVHENMGNEVSLNSISKELNYSTSYISRVFKSQTGKMLNKYIKEIKMEMAKKLLDEGYYVYEVCEKLGYKSLQHFGKLFKDYTGQTPMEYRTKVAKQREKE